ncbi:hypothetical protein BDF20DRAFT_54978 [Mycotypha africana]|uniref:uncharacterized protein n=1 Tax=Mycotypha africana TaxID=64632 RepID=UPI002300C7DE|nr:uncharacterized protein BDF20DRAFT_54978 [Mycotypha africana]KAI8991666.1 hypothetical protein BDF20DRAFT_54978 [Mycotypha africana]
MDTLNITNRAQEPNPFEESFSSTITTTSMPLKGLDSSIISYVSDNPILSDYTNGSSEESLQFNAQYQSVQRITPQQSIQQSSSTNITTITATKKRTRKVKVPKDEEKRKNFLERNRLAALKCRQRKKQWLLNLQARVEFLTNDNEQLQLEAEALRKEIMDLKTLLVTHKDCPNYNNSATAYYPHHFTVMKAAGSKTKAIPVNYENLLQTSATTAAAAALYHTTITTNNPSANSNFF